MIRIVKHDARTIIVRMADGSKPEVYKLSNTIQINKDWRPDDWKESPCPINCHGNVECEYCNRIFEAGFAACLEALERL